MNLALLPQMMSSKRGWLDLERNEPSPVQVFFGMVLPLSLLPPIMLEFAATHLQYPFLSAVPGESWRLISVIFFLAEIITFAGMGWLIREIAATYKVDISARKAYLIAALGPVPMWLSSLALFIDNIAIVAVIGLAGLVTSVLLVYRGTCVFSHIEDEIVAAGFTQSVIGASLIAWAALLILIRLMV